DPDWRVRSLALRGVRHSLVEEAGAAVPEALSRIRPLLDDSSYAVRIEAIRTLATFGPGPGLEAVVAAALGGGPHERAAAIEALGRAGADAMEASGPLLGIALDPPSHPLHRELAAEARARIDPPAAAANLPILLGEPSWRLRAAAGRALGALPELDYASIAAAATDSDPRVATATVRALAEREDTASLRSVRSIL